METLNVEIRLRNIPSLSPIPKPSEEEMINEFKSVNIPSDNQIIKDYVQFLSKYGSGKLGRVHLYGIYPSSTYYQFDIKFQTKRIQNIFLRMINDEERENSAETILEQHYDSTFKNFVIFAKDGIQETLYYAWNLTKMESIYLIEVDETLGDVRPPTAVCDNLLEFLQNACLGNYIHDENLHSTKYLKDHEDEDDDDESPLVENVFIPSLALKTSD